MKTIKELKERMAAAVARQKELAAKAELTAEETAEFDRLTEQFQKDNADVKRLQAIEDRSATVAAIAERPAQDATGVVRAVTEAGPRIQVVQRQLTGLETVGVCAWATLKNKHQPRFSALEHLEKAGFQQLADQSRQIRSEQWANTVGLFGASSEQVKALQSLSGQGGDNMITTPLLTDFIDFLRNTSVFLSSGPLELDMSYGTLDIPGGNAGVTGTYGAEGADIGYSQMTTRKVSMSAKHLRVITSMSNILIDRSPLAVASIVGNDVAMGMRLGMDSAGLRGDGSGDNPAGLLSLIHSANKFTVADNNEPSILEVEIETRKALTLYRASNVPEVRPVWIMANRTYTYLQFLRDGNNNLVYPGLSNKQNPTWIDGLPAKRSEQVPTNLGTGTNESEIYLNDFAHTLMGIARALALTASTEASYIDGSSAMVSAFARDETVIRGSASHDFDMRHTKAGVVLQGVKWGAP